MNLKGLNEAEKKELIPSDLIFLAYRGSIAHGMYVPNTDPNFIDDKDIMGVYLNPPEHYLGLNLHKETREKWYKEWDFVVYAVRKLLLLLLKGNPNVLSLLWVDPKYILHTSPAWEQIQKARDAFSIARFLHSRISPALTRLP